MTDADRALSAAMDRLGWSNAEWGGPEEVIDAMVDRILGLESSRDASTLRQLRLFADAIFLDRANADAAIPIRVDRIRWLIAMAGHPVAEDVRSALLKLESALKEHDNIRWDDVCARADQTGDDLGRMTRKYARYVRRDLVAACESLSKGEQP